MAYNFKDPKLAKLAKASKKTGKKRVKRKAGKKRVKRRAPAHFPPSLASELGYAPRKKRAKKAAKRRPAKKTKAQIHAMRVRQGKRLAALRKAQLAGKKRKARR